MKRKVKILLYSLGVFFILFLFTLGSKYLERYLQKVLPEFLSRMKMGEISFTSLKIDYLSQALKLNGLKYRLKVENFELVVQMDKCIVKFKRILSEWKKPLRRIEIGGGYIKLSLNKEEKGEGKEFSIPSFLEGSSISIKKLLFQIHTPEIETEGEVIGFQTDKISEIISGSIDLYIKKLLFSDKEIPVKSLSTDFMYTRDGISLFNLFIESEIGTLLAYTVDWDIGKRSDFNFKIVNLKHMGVRLGYGIFDGWYDFKKEELGGRVLFKKVEYDKFIGEEGEFRIKYSTKNKLLVIEEGMVKYKDGFLKIKRGTISRKGDIGFDIELVDLPFESFLFNTGGIESRVFNKYNGAIKLYGSLKPLMLSGDAKLESLNFLVCEDLYPSECRNSIFRVPKGNADIKFEIRPYGVDIIDAAIYLPNSKGYITADGNIFFEERLNLNIRLHSFEIGYISSIAGIPMGGMMKGEVYITGPFNDISIYYRGDIKNYSLLNLRFEDGNYTIFYRNEVLYYSGAVKTKKGGSLLANGFIDFSGEPSIHHISSLEEIESDDLTGMIGLPETVKEEIDKISATWNGSFLMDGSIKEKLPNMFGHLEISSQANYMGEVIDGLYAEGYFSDGEVAFKGYGIKGNEVFFEGGYKNGIIYTGISGNIKIDTIKAIKSADVNAEIYGEIFSPSLSFSGRTESLSFMGEIEKEMKEVFLTNKDFIFYKQGINSNEIGGCLVESDPTSFLKYKDISSKVNGCFIGSFSEGKIKLDAILKNSFIKVKDEVFYLKDVVKIKGTRGRLTFEGEEGFFRLTLSKDDVKITFRFPGEVLSIFEGLEIKRGFAEGNITFSIKDPLKSMKGNGRVENLSVGMRYIKFEKIWGEAIMDGKNINFRIYSSFPTEVSLEGTYSIEEGIITTSLKTSGIKIRREGLNAEVNSSIMGRIEPNKISLDGEIEFTKLFLPFDPSSLKNLSFPESKKEMEFEIENLRIKLPNVKVKGGGNELSGKGEITVKVINSPLVSGKLNFDGKISYFGKEFEITKGELLWEGAGVIPFVDIIATTTQEKSYVEEGEITSSYQVFLSIRGPANSLAVDLYSSPSLSREDILAFLFTGKTIKDIYESPVKGEGATVKIYEIGSEAILGPNVESLKRILRLDKFTMYPKYSETLHKTTTFMSIGKKIGEELWLEYSRDLNYEEQMFRFLWKPAKSFSLRSGWDNQNTKNRIGNSDLGNISVDFVFQYEF